MVDLTERDHDEVSAHRRALAGVKVSAEDSIGFGDDLF
jgi:hypothetical protein